MVQLLVDNPLLLPFVVAALGYLLGRIQVFGFPLGIAAVLFVGLAIGSLDPEMRVPDIVFQGSPGDRSWPDWCWGRSAAPEEWCGNSRTTPTSRCARSA